MACLAGGGVAFIACAAGTTDSACYTGAGGSGATYPGTCTVGPSA